MASIMDTASKIIDKSKDVASDMFEKSKDVASDVFEKSKDVASDLAGSAGDLASKGVIKAKLYDQGLEYDKLMRLLGVAIYDQVKDDPAFVDEHKDLFNRISASLERKQMLEDELVEIDAAAAASKPIDVEPLESDDVKNEEKAE